MASPYALVALDDGLTVKPMSGRCAAPNRENALAILERAKTDPRPLKRVQVTGPPGLTLEIKVPNGSTYDEIMSLFQATRIMQEVKEGWEFAPELSERMDKAELEAMARSKPAEELVQEWEDVLSEMRSQRLEDKADEGGKHLVIRALRGLAASKGKVGQHDAALPLLEEVVGLRKSMNEDNKTEVIECISDVAAACMRARDLDGVWKHNLEALGVAKAEGSGVKYSHLTALHKNCGQAAEVQGKLDEALPYYQEAYRRSHDPEHMGGPDCRYSPVCTQITNLLARCLVRLGRFDEAIPVLEELVEVHTTVRNQDSLAFALEMLGFSLQGTGQTERAVEVLEQGLTITRSLNTGDTDRGAALATTGQALLRAERYERAVSVLEEALTLMSKHLPADHPGVTSIATPLRIAKEKLEAQQKKKEGSASSTN